MNTDNWPFDIKVLSDKFKNKNIYYSGSIRGIIADPEIGKKIVTFLTENGAYVSSAHVAASSKEEMNRVFFERSGKPPINNSTPSELAYEVDMKWVDEASHLIAIVDGPSFGVGMEIMRALKKPQCGLNSTPVLCLVNKDNLDKLSKMIRGANFEFGDMIQVRTYKDFKDTKKIITEFLKN